MSKFNEMSLSLLFYLIDSGELKPSQLLEACLERISLRDPEVLAFTTLNSEISMESAQILDNETPDNALFGIPVGIKDIMDTTDMPTTRGSPLYEGYYPIRDAACVASCICAGAIIPGKTETTEFAYFKPGKTRNPHALTHTPGGSSMGSAAAVADNMLPVALGTQTAGSVTRPAAYCGVVGYKASHGAFSLNGVCELALSLDSLGFFVREVRDLALIRHSFLGARPNTIPSSNTLRIGLVRTPHWHQADQCQRDLIDKIADSLASQSLQVSEIEVGPPDDLLAQAHAIVMQYEVAHSSLVSDFLLDRDSLSSQFIELIELGLQTTFEDYQEAKRQGEIWQSKLQQIFQDFDILLAPSAPGEAPEGLESTGDPIFSRMWTLLKVPTITLPAGFGPNNLPLGIQLIGAYNQDDTLIANATSINDCL